MNVECGTDINSGSKIQFLRIILILQKTTSNFSSFWGTLNLHYQSCGHTNWSLRWKNLVLPGMGPSQQTPGSTPQQMPTLIIPYCLVRCFHCVFLSWEWKEIEKVAGRSVRPYVQKHAVILFIAVSCCFSLYNVPLPM